MLLKLTFYRMVFLLRVPLPHLGNHCDHHFPHFIFSSDKKAWKKMFCCKFFFSSTFVHSLLKEMTVEVLKTQYPLSRILPRRHCLLKFGTETCNKVVYKMVQQISPLIKKCQLILLTLTDIQHYNFHTKGLRKKTAVLFYKPLVEERLVKILDFFRQDSTKLWLTGKGSKTAT